eukprot:1016666_1
MHKKIKQRLSLTYSTTPSSKSSPPDTPTSNQSDPTPPPRRHKKKRSLVGSAFKHLNLTLHHGHHHHDNHDHPVKNTTLIQLSDDQNGGLPRPRLMPSRLRKSLSFSHGHGNKKRASLLPTTTKIKSRYISRSNSITNTKSPIAEEDTIEIDDPFEFSDLDAGISPPLTLSPNKLWSSKSSTLHRHSTPFLPPPASPPQSGSPRGFAEHEKRTLIEQMRQLQASMVQLGNMLTNQDKDLNIEKGKNSQLTEQVNNLADENMALRQQIKKARQDRNSVWQELQLKMLAERTRRDKNLLLTNQVNELTQQKDGLSAYSQKLVEQLTQEKQKTYALTMRVKKYSKTVKRNVKSLHKKTSSLSGLSFYRNALEDISSDPSLVNSLTEIKDDKSDSVSPTVHVQSVIIESPLPEEEAMTPLQQKQAELKELEAQTLDILNQLKEETRMLLDDTRGLSKRSNKRLGNTKKKSSKKKRRKKTPKQKQKKTPNKAEKQNKTNDDLYHDVYWCTHSYHHQTHKKQQLPSGIIETNRTTGITPMNTKKTRKRDRKAMINQALNDASKALMLSAVPKYLPCREKEHDEIEAYMKQQIMSRGQGSGLYISGMPGTGKTATVRQIANELKRHVGRGKKKRKKQTTELPDFEFVEINAMKLPTPQHIYTELTKQLLGKHFAPNTAVRKLVKYFSTKDDSRKVIVLLVDELDFLLTRQQKVIYNLFDWPTKAEAKLVVIGIANTMDLPERLLPRVSSRLGTQRVVFKSYARHQLTEIIEQRLESTKVFSADAIRFCASAVAGVSGDCRTALQICRRAVEIAQKDVAQNGIAQLGQRDNHNTKRVKTRSKNKRGKAKCDWENDYGEEIVTLQHLKSAKDAFDQTNDIQIVSMCSIYEKLFLTAIVMCNTRSDGFAGMTRKYRQKFDNFVQTRLGDSKMGNVHFRNMVDRLEDVGILKIDFEKNDWKEFITFNVKMDEAMHALKENDVCAKILSTLQAV